MRRALLALCVAALAAAAAPAAAAQPAPPTYLPPVDAPVLDGFRPPTSPFGAGNRGLEYGTRGGTPVRAVAAGRVTFAGPVAGSLHVTVLHEDGVRTTYSFLAAVEVVIGQAVGQGQVVGVTAGALHLGARRGDAYFDPSSLFRPGPPQVHLVPFEDPPGEGAGGERSAIRQLIGGAGRLLGSLPGPAGAVGGWLRDGGGQLLGTIEHYARRFTMPMGFVDSWFTIATAWQRARSTARRECTAVGVAPPPPTGRRVAVLVAGLGSQSESSTVDQVRTAELGYAPADVLRFSYAGGRVPDPTDGFATVPTSTYGAAETQIDLRASASRLADVVEEVVATSDGAPVDLIAHSQGGVVARLALIELERRHGPAWLAQVGLFATLGTPHGGADLATAVHAWSSTSSGGDALDAFAAATGQELDDDSPSIAQLGETSDVVAELAENPVPASITAVSIAARGDLVVPVPRSRAPGMDEVVVPLVGRNAHSDLPGSSEATRALALARAGMPPPCQDFREALADQAAGEGISLVEDLVGAAGLFVAARADVRAG